MTHETRVGPSRSGAGMLVACVLVIASVPWLTLAPLRLFGF